MGDTWMGDRQIDEQMNRLIDRQIVDMNNQKLDKEMITDDKEIVHGQLSVETTDIEQQ